MCFPACKKVECSYLTQCHDDIEIYNSVLVIACVFICFTFECTVDYLVIVAGVGAQIIEKRECDTMGNQSRNIAACNAVPHPTAHRVPHRQ